MSSAVDQWEQLKQPSHWFTFLNFHQVSTSFKNNISGNEPSQPCVYRKKPSIEFLNHLNHHPAADLPHTPNSVSLSAFSQPVVLAPFTFVLLSTSRSPWSLFMQPLGKPYEIVPGGPCVSWLSVTRRENIPASHLFKQDSAIEKINVN